jgi:YqaJ-like viral recombinase domain
MPIIKHDFEQRSDEWYSIRCGRLTASSLHKILTPAKLEFSKQAVDFAYQIAAERWLNESEPTIITMDMQRGIEQEAEAIFHYQRHFGAVEHVGFLENTDMLYPYGASPDGLIDGGKGGIEIKCPQAKKHLRHIVTGEIDGEYMLQMQGTMLAGGLEYMQFISFYEGMAMMPHRVERDEEVIAAIIEAGKQFEEMVSEIRNHYRSNTYHDFDLYETEEAYESKQSKKVIHIEKPEVANG